VAGAAISVRPPPPPGPKEDALKRLICTAVAIAQVVPAAGLFLRPQRRSAAFTAWLTTSLVTAAGGALMLFG
jgi:hypothetical protein